MIRIAASVIAFADWLGQQDETLVQCYEKRLKLWGVKARGKQLTNLCKLYGVERRWFGLEPDFMLRKRATKIMGSTRR